VPIRQALIQLESDGLVDLRDRRSAVVTTLTPAQVREVYNIRIVLETHALALSMETMTPERVDRLKELAHIADAEREGASFLDARSEFYAELYDAPRQPMLWEHIEQLRLKVGRYVLGWRLVGAGGHSHESLLYAVASGDADAAISGLRHHLEMVRDAVLSRVEEAGQ
jgi:DNA-binding GntR family transcriptional regulator